MDLGDEVGLLNDLLDDLLSDDDLLYLGLDWDQFLDDGGDFFDDFVEVGHYLLDFLNLLLNEDAFDYLFDFHHLHTLLLHLHDLLNDLGN